VVWGAEGGGRRWRLGLGFGAGLLYFSLSLYWLGWAARVHGGRPLWLASAAVLALALYHSIFWALALEAGAWLRGRLGGSWALSLPLAWGIAEWLRSLGPLGFSWGHPAYALVELAPLRGVAALGGLSLAGGLVSLINGALIELVAPGPSGRRRGAVALAAALAAAGVWTGAWEAQLATREAAAPSLEVALIQGNWGLGPSPRGRPEAGAFARRLLELTQAAAAEGAALIVWPEAAWPWDVEASGASLMGPRLAPLRGLGASLLFSGDSVHPGGARRNSAWLLDPELRVLGRYDKHHLMPFGEYMPAALPFPPLAGDLAPGARSETLSLPGGAKVGPLICYDALFPGDWREALAGAELFALTSNDAWFGPSSAPHLLLRIARFRALEQGRAVARAANTGVSALIGPRGELLATLPVVDHAAPPQLLRGRLPRIAAPSPYARVGEVYLWLCALGWAWVLWRWGRGRGRGRFFSLGSEPPLS